jgi:hypothetical protein
MSATADSSCGELSEAKHLWLLLWRTAEEMIRDSSPAGAGQNDKKESNRAM